MAGIVEKLIEYSTDPEHPGRRIKRKYRFIYF